MIIHYELDENNKIIAWQRYPLFDDRPIVEIPDNSNPLIFKVENGIAIYLEAEANKQLELNELEQLNRELETEILNQMKNKFLGIADATPFSLESKIERYKTLSQKYRKE